MPVYMVQPPAGGVLAGRWEPRVGRCARSGAGVCLTIWFTVEKFRAAAAKAQPELARARTPAPAARLSCCLHSENRESHACCPADLRRRRPGPGGAGAGGWGRSLPPHPNPAVGDREGRDCRPERVIVDTGQAPSTRTATPRATTHCLQAKPRRWNRFFSQLGIVVQPAICLCHRQPGNRDGVRAIFDHRVWPMFSRVPAARPDFHEPTAQAPGLPPDGGFRWPLGLIRSHPAFEF